MGAIFQCNTNLFQTVIIIISNSIAGVFTPFRVGRSESGARTMVEGTDIMIINIRLSFIQTTYVNNLASYPHEFKYHIR